MNCAITSARSPDRPPRPRRRRSRRPRFQITPRIHHRSWTPRHPSTGRRGGFRVASAARVSSRRCRSWASRAPSRPPPGHRSPSHRRERRHRSFSPTHSRASASNRRRGRRMIRRDGFRSDRKIDRICPRRVSARPSLARSSRERRARSSRSRDAREDDDATRTRRDVPETSSRPIRSSPHRLRIPRASRSSPRRAEDAGRTSRAMREGSNEGRDARETARGVEIRKPSREDVDAWTTRTCRATPCGSRR